MNAERHIMLCVACSPKFEEVTELDADKPLSRIRCACCGRSRDGYSYAVRIRKSVENRREIGAKDKV